MSRVYDSLYWACFYRSKHRIFEVVNQNNVKYVHHHFGDTPLHQACKQGWLDIVEIFIEKYGGDPNIVTKSGESLLHYACRYGHTDIVTLLIERYGCDPNVVTESDESPLHYACRYGHNNIVKLLIKKYGCDPNVVTKSDESLLHYVCQYGCIINSVVTLLIKKYGCDPNVVTKSGETPLHYACRYGHTNIVELLIERYGCDPNVMTKSDESLLHYICQYGCIINVVMLLIEKYGCDPNVVTKSGESPLHYACRYGHTNIVELLIERYGCDPNVVTKSDESLLHYICQYGCIINVVTLLIEKYGCDPNVVTKSGESPLHYACRYGHTNIVELLIERCGCDPNVVTMSGENLLHYACNQFDVIKLLIEKCGCDPNAVTKSDESLLHYVCQYGCIINVITILIEKYDCDPNVVTKSNQSLLHYACRYGNIDVVKYFINKHRLNPLTRDNINQLEPLDYAISNNRHDIVVYLCQHISSDDMINPNRIKTTINLIKYYINIIFEAHARVRSNKDPIYPMWKTADGDNILQLMGSSKTCIAHIPSAVVSEILNFHTANCFISYFKPDLRTADGDTVLRLVCQSRRVVSQISSAVLIKWLSESTNLMKIVRLDRTTADGNNFLELICQSEKSLIQMSSTVLWNWLRETVLFSVTTAIPDGMTADGNTLLQLILRSEMSISRISSQMLAKLLSNSRKITINEMKKVNPNWKTVDGAHFPHVLCLSNINKVTELIQYYILENGWNPNTFDSDRNTVLHIACKTDKFALVSYLINETQCNPNIKNYNGILPVDMTFSLEVVTCLCQHDQVAVPSKTIVKWLNNSMLIDDTTMLCILKSLIDNKKTISITRDGSTLLHVVCTMSTSISRDKSSLVKYLLTECQCDPNCLDNKGQMPLQLTSDSEIMNALIEHNAKMTIDTVFKVINMGIPESRAIELLTLSSRKGTMLWQPTDLNKKGEIALDLAYTLNKQAIVDYLLTKVKYDPNASDLLNSLLKLTENVNVAKLLIKHGARVTPDLVLRFEAMEFTPNKSALLELMLTTWNPDDRDSDGYTALHLACKADRPTTVYLLLSYSSL